MVDARGNYEEDDMGRKRKCLMTQIITDIGIVECPMNNNTTKRCHQGNGSCIGSDELKISACLHLHICRNVKNEMGITEKEGGHKNE